VIYVCVPVRNEARTVGLVLWRVRQVFAQFEREYQLLVCDDASTDQTAELLASYARVLPMTVVTHGERRGYARSVEELLRLALQRTDRPKRDCAITLHADFLHTPDVMDDMVKRVESGADLVVGELLRGAGRPPALLWWARRLAPRLLPVAGVQDSVSGFLAARLSLVRQITRQDASRPLLSTDGWCANAELLTRLASHARRIETVTAVARYDLRQRPSRISPWRKRLAAGHGRPGPRTTPTAVTASLLLAASLAGQSDSSPPAPIPPSRDSSAVTAFAFPVGERMRYQAKFGFFNVGEAVLEVAGMDTTRGVETVRIRFDIEGGALWYDLEQTMHSWVGRADFRSRRFEQDTRENNRKSFRRFDIFPDSGYYRLDGADTVSATVQDPLDDAAFLYWVRTVPLEIGKRYAYHRYFRPDRNPVIVQVLKRERVGVAGRKWNAIVIRPIIPHGRGIFAEKADAKMWISDDDRRVVLAIVSTFSFGTVMLKLKEYTTPERP
jgi:glycosyltransferase involved in cell wall biosynthesis